MEILNLNNEHIKEVPGYPELFASDSGDIYRRTSDGSMKKITLSISHGATNPYKQFTYKGKRYIAHRVIARAWIDSSLPIEGTRGKRINPIDVDHKNNETLDNRVENLQILTHQQNIMKRYGEIGAWSKIKPKKTFVYFVEDETVREFSCSNAACRYICALEGKKYNPGYSALAIKKHVPLFKKYGLGFSEEDARRCFSK